MSTGTVFYFYFIPTERQSAWDIIVLNTFWWIGKLGLYTYLQEKLDSVPLSDEYCLWSHLDCRRGFVESSQPRGKFLVAAKRFYSHLWPFNVLVMNSEENIGDILTKHKSNRKLGMLSNMQDNIIQIQRRFNRLNFQLFHCMAPVSWTSTFLQYVSQCLTLSSQWKFYEWTNEWINKWMIESV